MTSFRSAPPERLVESDNDPLKTLRALAQRYRELSIKPNRTGEYYGIAASRVETIIGTTAVDQTETSE